MTSGMATGVAALAWKWIASWLVHRASDEKTVLCVSYEPCVDYDIWFNLLSEALLSCCNVHTRMRVQVYV